MRGDAHAARQLKEEFARLLGQRMHFADHRRQCVDVQRALQRALQARQRVQGRTAQAQARQHRPQRAGAWVFPAVHAVAKAWHVADGDAVNDAFRVETGPVLLMAPDVVRAGVSPEFDETTGEPITYDEPHVVVDPESGNTSVYVDEADMSAQEIAESDPVNNK